MSDISPKHQDAPTGVIILNFGMRGVWYRRPNHQSQILWKYIKGFWRSDMWFFVYLCRVGWLQLQ